MLVLRGISDGFSVGCVFLMVADVVLFIFYLGGVLRSLDIFYHAYMHTVKNSILK